MSAEAPEPRRAVHPYRDRREALIARRRTLERELADAERAASRRDRVVRHLAVIDDELSTHRPPLLDSIAIDTPCRARWEDMQGDDVVRRCDRCQRDVHDLSHMTREEIEALFARATTTPCVRFRRRPDGRIVTGDCPIERPSVARRALRVVTAGALFGMSAAGAASLVMPIAGVGHVPPPMHATPARLERVSPPRHASPAPRVDVDRLATPPPDDGYTMGAAIVPVPITDDDLDHHIRWIAPQAWEIDASLVDRVLEQVPVLHPSIRVIPHERDGRAIGVKIYGVRRGSIYDRLGLRNGDVILDVNGMPLVEPDAALGAYAALRRADALFVRIERAGQERVHVYRITP